MAHVWLGIAPSYDGDVEKLLPSAALVEVDAVGGGSETAPLNAPPCPAKTVI
jgi:hypothetical protein